MENQIIELKDSSEIEDYSIKIVIVGDSGVGKSNILTRYVQNEFNDNSKATVGVELSTKTFKINDKIIKVHLWDTAGQERYKSITAAYYKGARGAMIVYDITKQETFNNVDRWFNEIREYGEKNVCLMMIGNKCDLEHLRTVENSKALDKASILGIPLMETSALDNTNISEAFKKIIGEVYLHAIKNLVTAEKETSINHGQNLTMNKVGENKKSGCC